MFILPTHLQHLTFFYDGMTRLIPYLNRNNGAGIWNRCWRASCTVSHTLGREWVYPKILRGNSLAL